LVSPNQAQEKPGFSRRWVTDGDGPAVRSGE
jgi:hypothetical protein